ncbi:MAG: two-component sensor histidine kinase [Anaerolineaceae bacterium]|nr:two-component sensor histidine kinase [Anaerolineaceae bacterium]
MSDYRPDPDRLLAAVQKDEARQQRGKLKIFIGMAAGVGKTYAMLDAARQLRAEGVDVVVGFVETHGRAETEALLSQLEVMPRKALAYREAWLEELDTDALLTRQPKLALVDELAHSNVPGSRHAKRYQDVIELLEAGIDVWTTVNVQHFESRADAVKQITGITVHERVPDSILDMADEIELVDLSPDDLRKRLAEGKVYTPERIDVAASNFFRTGNLTALREMALRLTAEHVDHKLQDYMQLKQIAGPWKSRERLMVAVGASPFSEQLIRWTRRMAYNLEAPWIAVHVETGQTLSPDAQERLARNLDLVRSLGGEIVTTTGETIADALLHIARQRNVTQIVIGKPGQQRWMKLFRQPSMIDRLISGSGDIDVYVVTGEKPESAPPPRQWQAPSASPSSWLQSLLALAIVGSVTGLNLLIVNWLPWVRYQAVGLTELLAVLLIAVYLGRGPALLAATASAISWNFLFIEPRLTFEVSQVQDVILLFLYFAIALFTGNLTARIRRQERQARASAERTMALYTLAHETAMAVTMDDILQTSVLQIAQVFDAQVAIMLTGEHNLVREPHPCSTFPIDEKDYAVALWVYQNRKTAGAFTDTLPLASAQFFPLLTPDRTVGVIGIRTRSQSRLTFEQEVLLQTFVSLVALVIERELLDEAAAQSAVLRESEKLYTALLNSISHELRTPIATITGAASSLIDPMTSTHEESRGRLIDDIQIAARRLNRLVENLLDMSRLESGRLMLKWEWCDVGDIIGVAVQRMTPCFDVHPLTIQLPPDLPLIQADFVLLEQVIVNLLDNACTYTPAGTAVTIAASLSPTRLQLAVRDSGPGIPPSDLDHIFDKFYRVSGTIPGGTGLGLSICRGLIEAHGGTLTAENMPEGGVQFVIRLPLKGSPPPVQEAQL